MSTENEGEGKDVICQWGIIAAKGHPMMLKIFYNALNVWQKHGRIWDRSLGIDLMLEYTGPFLVTYAF